MISTAALGTDRLEVEFREACEEFARARATLRGKDTPAARRQVEERLAAINAVLDRALDRDGQARTAHWAV